MYIYTLVTCLPIGNIPRHCVLFETTFRPRFPQDVIEALMSRGSAQVFQALGYRGRHLLCLCRPSSVSIV